MVFVEYCAGSSIKKSVVGANCEVGNGVKINGCVLMEGVTIEEGCSLNGVTVCANARIGAGSNLKEGSCVGRGYHVPPNTNALKGAHFTAGPGAGGGLMDD